MKFRISTSYIRQTFWPVNDTQAEEGGRPILAEDRPPVYATETNSTASVATPIVSISVTSVSNATAEVSAPTISNVGGGNVDITHVPCNATAQINAPTPTLFVATQATASASSASPIPSVTINAIANATAASSSPQITISVTAAAYSNASITTPQITISIQANASSATSENSSPTPVVSVTVGAIASASINSPAIEKTTNVTINAFVVTANGFGNTPLLILSVNHIVANSEATISSPTPKITIGSPSNPAFASIFVPVVDNGEVIQSVRDYARTNNYTRPSYARMYGVSRVNDRAVEHIFSRDAIIGVR